MESLLSSVSVNHSNNLKQAGLFLIHAQEVCHFGIDSAKAKTVVVAYDQSGSNRNRQESATQEIAQTTCAIVRDELTNLFGEDTAQAIRIQYGGSVKAMQHQ